MTNRTMIVLAALLAPLNAFAVPVTWELTGNLFLVDGQLPPALAGIDDDGPFTVLLSFDTDAELLNTRTGPPFAPGIRYEYDPSSISVTFISGTLDPISLSATGDPSDFLWLRDDSADASAVVRRAEGYSFSFDTGQFGNVSIDLISSLLDVVVGPGLPTDPDPRSAGGAYAVFAYSDIGFLIQGDISGIRSLPGARFRNPAVSCGWV